MSNSAFLLQINEFFKFRQDTDAVRIMRGKLRNRMAGERVAFNEGGAVRRNGHIPSNKTHLGHNLCRL